MNEALELLERYGLIRDEDSLGVSKLSKVKIRRLHEDLYSAIFDKQVDEFYQADTPGEIDPFTFVPSRSLRGEADCGSYDCRLEKLDALARYTALYATKVILPLPLQHPSKVPNDAVASRQLSHASLALLHLRPLVNAGLLSPVVMRSPECVHTIGSTERMIEAAQGITHEAIKDLQNEYHVRFQLPEASPTGAPTAYIDGPEEFIEHGHVALLFDEPKSWRLKSWRYDKQGLVELRGARKYAMMHHVFDAIASDTTFYLAYGRKCNARYLASRKGETFLLDMATRRDEELSASSAALNAFMSHSLPLLDDLSLAKLLKIRKEERDSFARYRLAVGKMLADVASKKKKVGPREVREVFKEQIEPELAKMKSELYQERRLQLRRVVAGVGSMAASLAVGAFGSALSMPIQALGIAAAGTVGTALLRKAAESTCEHGANMRAKNDFYFLLRLTQESESSR